MSPALADNDVILITLFLIVWLIFCIRMGNR
jgi:hypothetical protein